MGILPIYCEGNEDVVINSTQKIDLNLDSIA